MVSSIHVLGSHQLGGADRFFIRLVEALHRAGHPTLAVIRADSPVAQVILAGDRAGAPADGLEVGPVFPLAADPADPPAPARCGADLHGPRHAADPAAGRQPRAARRPPGRLLQDRRLLPACPRLGGQHAGHLRLPGQARAAAASGCSTSATSCPAARGPPKSCGAARPPGAGTAGLRHIRAGSDGEKKGFRTCSRPLRGSSRRSASARWYC